MKWRLAPKPHWTEEKTEGQRGPVIHQGLRMGERQCWDQDSGVATPKPSVLWVAWRSLKGDLPMESNMRR